MLNERASGILLHPTSLPGKYGIGTLGKAALDFIDFLAQAKQQYWQILPLGPTGVGDSPYQCFSAHAGNPNLIDLDLLVEQQLLNTEDLKNIPEFDECFVDFDGIQAARKPLLRKAYQSFTLYAGEKDTFRYQTFLNDQVKWISDYALFMAIKESRGQKPWYQWEDALKLREPEALSTMQTSVLSETGFHKFLQFLFFSQWIAVREYANKHNVKIIGDIPLYISLDSADAWANPELFEFDEKRNPLHVGGVPPDYFSETGQLWGNPLYRWEALKASGYRWWIDRIRTNLFLYDIIRIDHFRGFAAYWAIPYGEKTAIKGEWVSCDGKDFFEAMKLEFGNLPIIAEDLGVITPDVEELRDGFGFPGMKILEFAFDSSEANNFLPHNYTRNCVVYTGTHDNDTVVGWFQNALAEDRKLVLDYINCEEAEIHWSFVRLAWASVAYTAIAPLQDLLGLDNTARMNLPGTTVNNWKWRAQSFQLNAALAVKLANLTILFGRESKSIIH